MKEGDLKVYAAEGTHEKVIEIFRSFEKGIVLDCPCGQGAFAKGLGDMDFKVVCADVSRDNFSLKNHMFCQLDMNLYLPFSDGVFDHVACIEGVEHIENPFLLLREFGRILKGGGNLILTTPNIMSIKSRARFFFYSYFDYFKYPSWEHLYKSGDMDFLHEHITAMTLPALSHALGKAGFDMVRLYTNRYRKAKKLGFFYPLFKMLVKRFTSRTYGEGGILVSDEVLEGDILIIHARKRPVNDKR